MEIKFSIHVSYLDDFQKGEWVSAASHKQKNSLLIEAELNEIEMKSHEQETERKNGVFHIRKKPQESQ